MNGADFTAYLKNTETGLSRKALDDILWRHPWFHTARIARMIRDKRKDPALELHFMFHPLPASFLKDVPQMESSAGAPSSIDIIENFIRAGKSRIEPDEGVTEDDLSAGSAELELSDELLSEELAEIYMRQGLDEKAAEILRKLGK